MDHRPKRMLWKAFNPAQPGLEAVPPGDTRIYVISPKNAAQWRIWKAPFPGIEAVSLIDKGGVELAFSRALPERCLTTVDFVIDLVDFVDQKHAWLGFVAQRAQ